MIKATCFIPLLCAAACGASAWGATEADWSHATGGNWDQAANWAQGVVPNNGTPSGSTYDVSINALGAAYTVAITGASIKSFSIDSLTIASNSATVTLNSGITLHTALVDVQAGALSINGTLVGARLQGNATAGSHATLTDVTLAGTLTASSLHATNSLAFDGGTLNVGGGIGFVPQSLSVDGGILSGVGLIRLGGSVPVVDPDDLPQTIISGSHLNFASGISLLITAGNAAIASTDGSAITNYGFWGISSHQTLTLNGPLVNHGTINVNGGTLVLASPTLATDIGTLTGTGGLIIAQALMTGGATLDLGQSSFGTLEINGTLDAPSVTGPTGSSLLLSAAGGSTALTSPTGVTLSVDTTFNVNLTARATITIGAGLTLADHVAVVNPDTFLALTAGNLNGSGVLLLQAFNSFGNAEDITVAPSTARPWTIASGVTIENSAGNTAPHGVIGRRDATLTNFGTIWSQASAGSITVWGKSWINQGTLKVTDGQLLLSGSTTTANLGTIVHTAGALGFSFMTLDNSNATFLLDAAHGTWLIVNNTTIRGGTLSADGGKIQNSIGSLTLDGVALVGDFTTSDWAAAITDDLTLNAATVTAALTFSGTESVLGTGTLTSTYFKGISITGTTTLTSGITLRTYGDSYIGNSNGSAGLVNNGVIDASDAGAHMHMQLTQFQNEGLIRIAGAAMFVTALTNDSSVLINAGTLVTTGPITNNGTITATDGVLDLSGPITNNGAASLTNTAVILRAFTALASNGIFSHTGQTLFAATTPELTTPLDLGATAFGKADLATGAQINGTLTSSAGALNLLASNTLVLNGVLAADLNMAAASQLKGNYSLQHATITMNGGAATLTTAHLAGTGALIATGGVNSNTVAAGQATLLVDPGISVTAVSQDVLISAAGLTNHGLLEAQNAGVHLTISAATGSNDGTLEALNGAGLIAFNMSLTNTGTLIVDGTSALAFQNLTDTPDAVTTIGLVPGQTMASLNVQSATLAGALVANFQAAPHLGQRFTWNLGHITGEFATVTTTGPIPDGLGVAVTYTSATLTMTIVATPEPTTLCLIAAAALPLLRRRRSPR